MIFNGYKLTEKKASNKTHNLALVHWYKFLYLQSFMISIYMCKLKLSILLVFSIFFFGNAQQYEIAFMGGGVKYIGDIGKEDYFYPSDVGGSLLFKSTINQWMHARIGFSYLPIRGDDLESENIGRQMRQVSFSGNLLELSLGIEYNFQPRNPYLRARKYNRLTPYMFSGISVTNYFGKSQKKQNGERDYSGVAVGIPMILGIKYKLSEHFLFSFESGARYTFTDNLDGSYSMYRKINTENLDKTTPSTNINSNDWYTFTSIGFIYTFGDLRCYFGF